ncbi:hypothetical protein [Pseudomonas sp. SCB32]|uniref:hypothetical protein n=1 Tax=Pseudomonas sp. SCB32 TaxID=2653853 RepID=UPI001264AAC0|nr:hypothetical protein [Pseudomonas sp. SCB32]
MELKTYFAQDAAGNTLGNATCYLYERGTEILASGLRKANGVTLANPFTTDATGLIQFAAANGLYDLRVTSAARDYRIAVQCNDVTDTISSVEAAASRAESARDVAQLSAGLKASIAEGLESTGDGHYFSVPAGGANDYLVLYQNKGGQAVEKGRYPSATAVQDVLGMIRAASLNQPYLSVVDEAGHVRFEADNAGGFGTREAYLGPEGLVTEALEAGESSRDGFHVTDDDGYVLFEVGADGTLMALSTETQESRSATFRSNRFELDNAVLQDAQGSHVQFVDEWGFVGMQLNPDGGLEATGAASEQASEAATLQLAARDAENLAASAAIRGTFNTEVQRPVCTYNHFLMYGQSLSTGFEGWPALSKTAQGGNLMFGGSPRPSETATAQFLPLGGAALNPLVAVTQAANGGSILNDAAVAALAPGAANEGESAEVGAMNFARKQFLQYHGLGADPSRKFVVSNCGVAGRSVEQLSKGASPELFKRLLQAAQGVKQIATTEGVTYCVPAILWMQGENNYGGAGGSDATKDGYKAKLKAQAAIWKADIAQGVAGQSNPPAVVTYQTGASYTVDTNDLAIGMAQWELAKEERNWFLATPIYPYTDKGGHLDANGYRWVGMQLGKVLHRVVTLGQQWKPLSPRRATVSGREILVDFHVPCPPLVFDTPYVQLTATSYAEKGFRILDDSGVVPVSAVELAASTIVRIRLGRDTSGAVRVQYGTKAATDGNGNLRDSDDTVASENYVYTAGSGQYAGANIPALIDKPYPLHNWCIAFSITADLI